MIANKDRANVSVVMRKSDFVPILTIGGCSGFKACTQALQRKFQLNLANQSSRRDKLPVLTAIPQKMQKLGLIEWEWMVFRDNRVDLLMIVFFLWLRN